MKRILVLSTLYFALLSNARASDEFTDGYYVTKGNDTLDCKILIPKDFGRFNEQSLFSRVTMLDSAGKKIKYTASEINGYGFIYLKKKYIYVSRQVDEDGKMMFVWPMIYGKKINEYYYYNYNTSDMYKGSMGATDEVYVLEDDETKETVAVTRGGSLTNTYKSQLRKFFENDKKVLAVLVQDVKDFHDIPKFVRDANK